MPQQVGTPRQLEGRGIPPMLNQPRKRPVWPFVLMGSVLGLAALAAVGTWVYGAPQQLFGVAVVHLDHFHFVRGAVGHLDRDAGAVDPDARQDGRRRVGHAVANLDISVTFAGVEDGTGDVFNVRKVKAAHVPDGQYWTRDGSRTAAQIDAQLNCHDSN